MIKNRKKGFTLIESMSALFIISIVVIWTLKFYKQSNSMIRSIESETTINTNLRIAQEFLVEKVRDSNTILLNGGSIIINGERIFVQNGILRLKTESQQIAPNVAKVTVENLGDNTYRITTIGKYETLSTIVKKREVK